MGRTSTRRNLVFGRSLRILTMMQSYASAAKLRAAAPFSKAALNAMACYGWPPPRISDRNRRRVRQAPKACRIPPR